MTIPDSVTGIGREAFSSCSGLTSVTIPDSVASIGYYAFYNCSGLTGVTIPDSVTSIGDDVFSGCSGLASVTIPDSVTSIGSYAFDGCSELTNVVIGSSVTSIGYHAFYNCSGLTSVTIGDGVTSIGSDAFEGCSDSLFDTTTILGVKLVDSWAIGYTDSLSGDLNLTGIRGIGDSAFSGCSGLTSVTIPNSVTNIGYYAFFDCSGLTSVTIPDSVTSIGDSAFYGCSGLTSVYITDLAKWCGVSFGSSGANPPLRYAHNLYLNGEKVTDLVVPDGVTCIGDCAFYNCSGLTSVTIPNSVTNIGESAFSGCSGLTSVTIPDSVTSIGYGAFNGCSGLTSVTIPDSVTSIGGSAFRGCSGLTSVTIPNSVTNIGYDAFSGCSGLTSITLPFVGSRRGNSGTYDSVFGYIFGTSSYPDGMETRQYYRAGSNYRSYYIPAALKTVVITGENVFGYGAFYNCTNLTSVTIPDSVTSIGDFAFSGCSGLTSVTIPDSVTDIGDYAFNGCGNLKKLFIPERFLGMLGWLVLRGCPADIEIFYYDKFVEVLHETLMAANSSETNIVLVVTNDCRVTFDWKCSCEPMRKGKMRDFLSFSVDGVQQDAICGEVDWTNCTFYVEGDGEHVLCWTYQKDASGIEGEDCGWIRNVRFVPHVTLTFLPGGAVSGTPPAPMTYYADDGVVSLPGLGSLLLPKHTFLGWSNGRRVFLAGSDYQCNADVTELTAAWARNELVAPGISAPEEFLVGETATVTISAEVGATVYYTLDGSAPSADGSSSRPYQGPFTVDATTTIRAIAVRYDYFDSPETTATVTKDSMTFGEAVNAPTLTFTIDGATGWRHVKGESPDGYALRSGVIGHNSTSRIDTVVVGNGRLTFSCKVAGEVWNGNEVYDGLAFLIDGIKQGDLMGNVDWVTNTYEIVGDGAHTLSWLYIKDDGDEFVMPEDCAWLDEVAWTPSGVVVDAGGGKSVTVPGAWLSEMTQRAATDEAANGRKVWECYVLGLDPENGDATNDFRIVSFPLKADGTPDLENIEFDPPQSKWNVSGARPVLKGAATLDAADWPEVTEQNKASFRFFKVEVELP